MAWIKMNTGLFENPRVEAIADATGLDTYGAAGRLLKLWVWVDANSEDGVDVMTTDERIDKRVGCDGFAAAMRLVGWLTGDAHSVTFVRFTEHNGATAKRRAQAAQRNAKYRKSGDSGPESQCIESGDALVTQGASPREEKIRQEKSKEKSKSAAGAACPPPIEYSDEFESWWKSYPTRPGASRGSKTQSHAEWVKLTPEQRTQLVKATNNLAKSDTFPKDAQRFLRPERGDRGGDPVWVGWIDLEPFRGLSRKNDRNTYGQDAASKADLLARMKSQRTEIKNAG